MITITNITLDYSTIPETAHGVDPRKPNDAKINVSTIVELCQIFVNTEAFCAQISPLVIPSKYHLNIRKISIRGELDTDKFVDFTAVVGFYLLSKGIKPHLDLKHCRIQPKVPMLQYAREKNLSYST